MSKLTEALAAGKPILMDGAMGTELLRAGIEPVPGVNVTHPELVQRIHESYVHAGARVLLTNTFQANQGTNRRVITAAVGLARAAARAGQILLASFGMPITERSTLLGGLPFDQLDGTLLETQSELRSKEDIGLPVNMAVHFLRTISRVPLLISMTFRRDISGRLETISGLGPEAIAAEAEDAGVAALGVNCGRDISLTDATKVLQAYRSACNLPLFARPNAGTPTRVGDRLVYPVTPAEMAAWVPEAIQAGAIMIGGCCGTTPQHIAACRESLAKLDR
jgi:5-methyltetrahydrofolate--homocysteine methyltransferase